MRSGVELCLERDPRPRQPAHDRADRYFGDIRRLLVTQPIYRHEQEGRALLERQFAERTADFLQSEPGFDAAYRLVRADMHALILARLLADIPGPQLIDPNCLRDPEHPAIEP